MTGEQMPALTIREVAEALGIKPNGASKKAKRNQWPWFEKQVGPGSPTKFYPFLELPSVELQVEIVKGCSDDLFGRLILELGGEGTDNLPGKIVEAIARRRGDNIEGALGKVDNEQPRPDLAPIPKKLLAPKEEKIALARAELISAYDKATKKTRLGDKTAAKQQFVEAYNRGEICPRVFEMIGPTSFKSIERWRLKFKKAKNDYFAVARKYPKVREKALTKQEEQILLNRALSRNNELISEIIYDALGDMETEGIKPSVSIMSYRRFLKDWQQRNNHVWVMSREGEKAYKDKCGWYVDRDLDSLQVGDMIVADGHTLNFETIDPATGKPKRMTLIVWFDMASSFPVGWAIMRTENTDAISLALRMAILVLGKVPKIAYMDNGRAFRGKYFKNVSDDLRPKYTGVFEKLGIQWIYARKHNARAKTVERFFEYLAEFERKAPSYIGTRIDTKPAHMRRGEKLHKKLQRQITGGRIPRLDDVYVALIRWIEKYINEPQPQGRLGDRTPLQVFKDGQGPGVDKHRLTVLMLRAKSVKISRCEVALTINQERLKYQSEALHGLDCKADVLYDPMYPDSVLVYHLNGDLICEAVVKEKINAAAGILGTQDELEYFRQEMGIQGRLEKETRQIVVERYEEHIIPMLKNDTHKLGFGEGVLKLEEKKKEKRQKEELEDLGAKFASSTSEELPEESQEGPVETAGKELYFERDYERYEHLLNKRENEPLSDTETAFMRDYEATKEYRMIYGAGSAVAEG